MLDAFAALKTAYESKEITLDDLKSMQAECDISFENRGIARSNLDCLLCSIVYNPLKTLKSELKKEDFASEAAFEALMATVLRGSSVQAEIDDESICYESELLDIVATKLSSGAIKVEQDDVTITDSFDVYMRVQH